MKTKEGCELEWVLEKLKVTITSCLSKYNREGWVELVWGCGEAGRQVELE